MCVTPVMKTEHNTKIQGTGAVQNIHQYSVDITECTCKIITAYKSNVGACHERKRLPKRTVYLQANVRSTGTKAHSGSFLMNKTPNPESSEPRWSWGEAEGVND